MALIQTFPSGKGGGGGGATYCYIVGSTAFAADWLSLTASGTALVPNEKLIYLILTAGPYYNNFVRWDATENRYLVVSKPIQLSTMPTASAEFVGQIVQYTGATTSSYTHNFFYECVNESSVYSWKVQTVEPNETVELTQQQFDALTPQEKDNGTTYFINDAQMSDAYLIQTGSTPIGAIVSMLCGNVPPKYYLICDGSIKNIADYSRLAAYFESTFGSKNVFGGDGTTTFAVPDMNSGANATPIFTLLPSGISPKFCIAYTDIYVTAKQDYSTEEQVIGTWIDGKPLYQKTVSVASTSTLWGAIYTVENADYIDVLQARYYYGTSGTDWIKMSMANGNDALIIATNGNSIVMNGRGFTFGANNPVEMTLQYTKTTD